MRVHFRKRSYFYDASLFCLTSSPRHNPRHAVGTPVNGPHALPDELKEANAQGNTEGGHFPALPTGFAASLVDGGQAASQEKRS